MRNLCLNCQSICEETACTVQRKETQLSMSSSIFHIIKYRCKFSDMTSIRKTLLGRFAYEYMAVYLHTANCIWTKLYSRIIEIAATTFSFSFQSFWWLCLKGFMQNTLNRADDQWWHMFQQKIIVSRNTRLKIKKIGEKEQKSGIYCKVWKQIINKLLIIILTRSQILRMESFFKFRWVRKTTK